MFGYNPIGTTAIGTNDIAIVEADTIAPVMVGSITVTSITSSSATLVWPEATDAIGVAGYEFSINGIAYSDLGFSRIIMLAGLASGSPITVNVRAYDAAGNRSATPLAVSFTTLTVSDLIVIPDLSLPSYIERTSYSGRIRLSLIFTDVPAPRGRTVNVGGTSTSIKSR